MTDLRLYLDALNFGSIVRLAEPETIESVAPDIPGWTCIDGSWSEGGTGGWTGAGPIDPSGNQRGKFSGSVRLAGAGSYCPGEVAEFECPFRRIWVGLPQQDPIVLDPNADAACFVEWPSFPPLIPSLQMLAPAGTVGSLLPESVEFIRALAAIDAQAQRAPAWIREQLAPSSIAELDAFAGGERFALTLEEARRVWIWRLAQAVYVDRFELFGPPVLPALNADDFHLLLDAHYGRWLTAGDSAEQAELTMPRDLVTASWYPENVQRAAWAGENLRWVVPPLSQRAAMFSWRIDGKCGKSVRPNGTVVLTCKTEWQDCIAQPGAQYFWRTATAEVVSTVDGRSDAAAGAEVSVHTGSIWDTNPLANLVEAMAAWERLQDRLQGRDPNLPPGPSGVPPASPYGAATVGEVVPAGNNPNKMVASAMARRARAALQHVFDLSLREFQKIPGVGIGAEDASAAQAPSPLTSSDGSKKHLPVDGATPNFSLFCRTLSTSSPNAISSMTAREQLALILLRTMNVPARIDMRPRPNAEPLDLLSTSLQVGGETFPLAGGILVPSSEPRGVAWGPMLRMPTIDRTVMDWNVFAGSTTSWATLVDPLQASAPSGMATAAQLVASQYLRGEIGTANLLNLLSAGPLRDLSVATMRALAIGLFSFGGVRHTWMASTLLDRWGDWASAYDPTTMAASGQARAQWLHQAFEVQKPVGKGGWMLREAWTLPGDQSMAWQGWPLLDGTTFQDVAGMTNQSGEYWAWRVAAWQTKVKAGNITPPYGKVMSSTSATPLEDAVSIGILCGIFAARIESL